MFPYKAIIQIDKHAPTPVYVQLANTFAREIRNGLLKPGTKLPGARSLADLIEVNRNTVVAAYEELSLQGYVELIAKKGAFISKRIPDIKAKPIIEPNRFIRYPELAGYRIKVNTTLPLVAVQQQPGVLEFNDGLPDERIAPLEDLTRCYRAIFKRGSRLQFGYTEPEGNSNLREAVSQFLNETRGFQTTKENIMITRGSQMGIFLLAQLLLKVDDTVLVGETNYPAADNAFRYTGAWLQRIKIDNLGIDVDAIEKICKRRKVRAVYVTPHHHFPTTITLSACRRMNLLALAEKYGFIILEDDYDYDFHYKSSPILPLASADSKGMVINIGSFSKNFSPALRVGYLVAPKNIIVEVARLRSIIDKQGDYLLEQAIAELFNEGIMKRHLRKALATYHERRNFLCDLLNKKLKNAIEFKIPEGGLAVWAEFDKSISLPSVAVKALKNGLILNDGQIYDNDTLCLNSTRLGFGSMNFKELDKAVKILERAIQ
jgi:GntR family transcriptional regulator / MocR family aminotransferase